MDRKEFITKLGAGAAFALTYSCLGGCVKMDNPAPPVDKNSLIGDDQGDENVDFTLDLTEPQNAPLLNNGGYVIVSNRYVVARTNTGDYVAATRICSDQQLKGIVWSPAINQWLCVEHNATFHESGSGTTVYNNLGKKGIRVYNTSLNGNLLHVFS